MNKSVLESLWTNDFESSVIICFMHKSALYKMSLSTQFQTKVSNLFGSHKCSVLDQLCFCVFFNGFVFSKPQWHLKGWLKAGLEVVWSYKRY